MTLEEFVNKAKNDLKKERLTPVLLDSIFVEQIEKFKTLKVSYKIGKKEIKKLFDISTVEDITHHSLINNLLCRKIIEIKD